MTDIQAIERKIKKKDRLLNSFCDDLKQERLDGINTTSTEKIISEISDEIETLEKNLYDLIQFESSVNSSLSFV
jgi:archaellum component FlaC